MRLVIQRAAQASVSVDGKKELAELKRAYSAANAASGRD